MGEFYAKPRKPTFCDLFVFEIAIKLDATDAVQSVGVLAGLKRRQEKALEAPASLSSQLNYIYT